jgi:hypothetical protein
MTPPVVLCLANDVEDLDPWLLPSRTIASVVSPLSLDRKGSCRTRDSPTTSLIVDILVPRVSPAPATYREYTLLGCANDYTSSEYNSLMPT